ncbi:MAG: hypothetical protein GY788_31425 [bacterium]|nr:hypothetical protein [bacterium]
MTFIFDIGSNNGDDIPYYLLKSERVVAFEANPLLCKSISRRFSNEINKGRLIVESGILCAEKDAESRESYFYVHKQHSILSQFPKPSADQADNFDRIRIPNKVLSNMLEKYDTPYYAKIDVEHYDHVILAEFFRLKSYPAYISAECHSHRVVSLLLNCPIYKGYKLVDGFEVQHEYRNAEIATATGEKLQYSFQEHSAGPFGGDIAGRWYDRKSFFRMILTERLGWKDMHASSRDIGDTIDIRVSFSDRTAYLKDIIRPYLPKQIRCYYKVIKRFY